MQQSKQDSQVPIPLLTLKPTKSPFLPFVQSPNSHLNTFFGGGLQFGMITQLYGQSGSGKTQTAMLFGLGAIERSLTVGYLSAGKDLHFGRFTELAYSYMNQSQYQQRESYLLFKKTNQFGSAMQFIQQIMSQIKQNQRGGLLIIDSVYTLINSCFQHFNIQSDNLQKSKKQSDFVNRIRWLSKQSKVAVLLINQASDNVDGRRSFNSPFSPGPSGTGAAGHQNLLPALGPSWDLNLDQSIQLSKRGHFREFRIVNSPKCRVGEFWRFRITGAGFVGISEEGVEYD